ncbi:MAG: hypothetical protein R3304_02235 [Longimicrobiales bacterium]|nr:hypothetical protein [Longimicrobiales bacterium]
MWELLGGLVVASAVSGVVPLVNAELLVVTAAAALPAVGVPLVAVASTVGQMSAKLSLFAVARWAPSRLPAKARDAVERASASLSEREGTVWSLVFASAATGIPPFYGISIAAGTLGVPPLSFATSGCLGRFLRFGALAWAGRQVGAGAVEMLSVAPTMPAFLGG